jgi:hypothetical protein
MSSTKPVVRSGGQVAQAPAFPALMRMVWRRLRPHSRAHATARTLSDHLLADVGLNGPGNERLTWERYIHRR